MPMKRLLLLLPVLLVLLNACKKDEDDAPPTDGGDAGPRLILKFKFDSTQVRLNNLGQPAAVPVGHGAQSPVMNRMSAHYVEFAPSATTLLGAGLDPRQAVGTVNTAEFFVSAAVVAAFAWSVASGRWSEVSEIRQHALAVIGIVAGGLVAAPLAGWTTKHVPRRPMTFAVGLLIVGLASWQWLQIAGWL